MVNMVIINLPISAAATGLKSAAWPAATVFCVANCEAKTLCIGDEMGPGLLSWLAAGVEKGPFDLY